MTCENASAQRILPPPLVHDLRARSSKRLHTMCGGPGKRGFGRVVRKHIAAAIAREKTTAEKAITIAYLGSFLTDHLVQAENNASLLLDERSLTPAEIQVAWEKNYDHVITRLLQEQPDGNEIRPILARLGNYSELPPRAHRFRSRHWHTLQHWLETSGPSAARVVTQHVIRVVDSKRSPHAKARAVILGGSLLADIECYATHTEWPHAYSHVMTDLYPALFDHGEILNELL